MPDPKKELDKLVKAYIKLGILYEETEEEKKKRKSEQQQSEKQPTEQKK